jgi:hypothetical protein
MDALATPNAGIRAPTDREESMASWTDLKQYVHNNYKIADENDDMIKLIFETDGLRSQVVIVRHVQLAGNGQHWVQIESPFGELGSLDLVAALNAVGDTVCGGMSLVGGQIVTFRHSVPLDDVSISEFEAPLHLVINTADRLEKSFTGGDKF